MTVDRRRLIGLAVLALMTLSLSAWAGTQYRIHCTNKACNFKTSVGFGGGFVFEEAVGYCAHCAQFVSVRWKRGEKGPEPVKVWDAATGGTFLLQKCPKCSGLFTVIPGIAALKHCPKCNQATIESKESLMYD
jgi:hypothetical protein